MDVQALIVQATKGLKLRDIVLNRSEFSRPHADSGQGPTDAFQQGKRIVRYSASETPNADGPPLRLLQVRIELGTRIVREPNSPEPQVLIMIEADYIAEYEVNLELTDEAIKAFAEFNAVHNIWPFWRQHVFDVVDRARLPRIEVPLFAGMKM